MKKINKHRAILSLSIVGALLTTSLTSHAESIDSTAGWLCTGGRDVENCIFAHEMFSLFPTFWPSVTTMTLGDISSKITRSLSPHERQIIAMAQAESDDLVRNYDGKTDGFKTNTETGERPVLSHNFQEARMILQAKMDEIEEFQMPKDKVLTNGEAAFLLSRLE